MRHVLCHGLFVLAICCLVPLRADAADAGKQRVTAFSVDLTPPLGSPSYGGKPLETVETPLLAKGIVLDDGRQTGGVVCRRLVRAVRVGS